MSIFFCKVEPVTASQSCAAGTTAKTATSTRYRMCLQEVTQMSSMKEYYIDWFPLIRSQADNDTWTMSSEFNGLFGYGLAQMDERTLWISGNSRVKCLHRKQGLVYSTPGLAKNSHEGASTRANKVHLFSSNFRPVCSKSPRFRALTERFTTHGNGNIGRWKKHIGWNAQGLLS